MQEIVHIIRIVRGDKRIDIMMMIEEDLVEDDQMVLSILLVFRIY